jgi:tyrosine-protein phosphatase YwqE
LMQRCWKTLPSARPRFREVNALLEAQTVPEAEPTKQSKKKFFSNFFPAKRKTSRQ